MIVSSSWEISCYGFIILTFYSHIGLFRHKQAKWTVCFAKWPYGCYDLCILPSYQKGVLEFIVYWFHQLLGFPDSKLLVLSYMWAAWVIYMLLWLIMMNVTNRLGALVRSLRVNILKGVFGINTCEQMLDKSSYICAFFSRSTAG